MTQDQILSQIRTRLESIPALENCSNKGKESALRGLLEFLPALRELTAPVRIFPQDLSPMPFTIVKPNE
jgi:hypothetical protein